MRKLISDTLIASLIGALVWLALQPRTIVVQPSDKPIVVPPTPRGPFRTDQVEAKQGSSIAPDGKTEVACDLPPKLQLHNIGGSDGSGLCVFTSISHAARLQNIDLLKDFRDWMHKYPGGGYPQKVDKMIEKIAKEKGVPVPDYIQVEGSDLEILKLACKTGRMPGITYSFSPTGRYNGQHIAHMVNLVQATDDWFCVLDNNFVPPDTPAEREYEWMTPEEFKKTYAPGGQGWAVIFLNSPPSPPPHN